MIQRGDVYLVGLDPVIGSEVGKSRPAIIVQNEAANRSSPTFTIIPISSRTERIFPFQVLLPAGEGGLRTPSKALCEQIRTVSRERLLQRMGQISPERLDEIRAALDRHLWF